jgi:hypothetical protein
MEGASTSKRGDRVYFPFSSSEGMVAHESPVKKEVEAALQGTDFKLKDYKMGVAIDKFGRETKLGKALTKLGKTDVLLKFRDDPTREASKKTDFIIVFSKHSYDIAGMSTDRGWTSCMDLYDGAESDHIQWDVKEGSFICYLTKPEDTNLNKPTGRILVKPYINVKNKKDVVYSPEQQVYGTVPNNFLNTVNDILGKIQDEKLGKFKLSQKLYCDTSDTIMRFSKPKDKSEVEKILSLLGVKNYTINGDLTVDVNGSVNLHMFENKDAYDDEDRGTLKSIPLQFRKVKGSFDCSGNQLTSLKGSPQSVGGAFFCNYNQLTSLEGAPQSVGEEFNCDGNKLNSLKGAPKSVGGDFYCSDNQPPLSESEKDWAEKNIKTEEFHW